MVPADSLHEYWSCTRKVQYGHLDTAERASKEVNEKHGKQTEAYHCGYCDKFHIGRAYGAYRLRIDVWENEGGH